MSLVEGELLYALMDLCVRRIACPDCPAGSHQPCMTVIGRAPGTPVAYYHEGRSRNGHYTMRNIEDALKKQNCPRCGEDVGLRGMHYCVAKTPIQTLAERGMAAKIAAIEAELRVLKADCQEKKGGS